MNASELRIGNLLQGSIVVTVSEILSNNRVRIDNSKSTFIVGECLSPIPLTEEWLVKFGFEFIESDRNYVKKTRSNFYHSVSWIHDAGESWLTMNIYDRGRFEQTFAIIKYVHQLQNIYFALMGEELKLK